MDIELYILPPLFTLPSVSGSCIAALSLCHLSLTKSSFKVIESTDLSIGLPALKSNGKWHRGYTNIKNFLVDQDDIDDFLTPKQKADTIAWGSLIEDLGETLTWNSLFVSRHNYINATRPELANRTSLPYSFILPTKLRGYAVRRCAEIGMIDDLEEVEKPSVQGGFTDTWLTRRRAWDEKARELKLHALASEFYAPLADLVAPNAGGKFLFSDSPSSLDALLYGHLILHFLPVLPDPVLRTTLTQSYPQLVEYLQRCHVFFEARDRETQSMTAPNTFTSLFQGWGEDKGKRKEDLIGIGAFLSVILGYTLLTSLRRS